MLWTRCFPTQELPCTESLSVLSLSFVSKTPEEVILCAALWLFINHRKAICWQLCFWTASLDWIKSVPRTVWLRVMSWSTSTALFHNGWERSSVCTRVHLGKRKVRQRLLAATNPEAEKVLWKRSFSPCTLSPALCAVPVKSWAGGEGMILQLTCQFCMWYLIQGNAV